MYNMAIQNNLELAATCEPIQYVSGVSANDGKAKLFGKEMLRPPSSQYNISGGGVSGHVITPGEKITATTGCLTLTNNECYPMMATFRIEGVWSINLPTGVNFALNLEGSFDGGSTWFLWTSIFNGYNDFLPSSIRGYEGEYTFYQNSVLAPSASRQICVRIAAEDPSYYCNGNTLGSIAGASIAGYLIVP
jgi:hypothetical protein